MGKLGGVELNYSSDIDLIFLYSTEGKTDHRRSITNGEFFGELARELLQNLVGDRPHRERPPVDDHVLDLDPVDLEQGPDASVAHGPLPSRASTRRRSALTTAA
mgnify:CR=1 FL=1